MLDEAKRRQAAANLLGVAAFPQQQKFVADPARYKAALCTRRSGKSYGTGLYLFQEALATPNTACLYVALTHGQAKTVMFRQVLQKIDRTYKLKARFNSTDLTVHLPNGSIIYLMGVDTTPEQQERVRGAHFRLVVVDEAGSFRNNLRNFVETVLRPLVWDDNGSICLIGTPRNIKNYFFDVTTGKEPGWSVHRWAASDNPHMAKQYAEEIELLKSSNPLFLDTPQYRQEYLGEWVIDDSKLVYQYGEQRNTVPSLPPADEWFHVVGLDLGFNDDTAWVVVAYQQHGPELYVREVKKEKGLIISQVAQFTQHLIDTYNPFAVVVDNAAKQSVEELKQRYGLPLEAASKHGKYEAVQAMNSDLITGRIKLLPGTEALSQEWMELVWDEKWLLMNKHVENGTCPNHLSDAALYAWRRARNYAFTKAPDPRPVRGSEEELEAWWKKEEEKVQRRVNARWLNDEWTPNYWDDGEE